MSRLEELINEYCPNGVEYIPFSSICLYIRGITYNKSKEATSSFDDNIRVLRANNINLATNTFDFTDVKELDCTVKVKDDQWLRKGDILICAGSGSKEHIGKVAYAFEDMPFTFGGFMAVIRCSEIIDSRFLFHILTGNLFRRHLEKELDTSTINNLNKDVMSRLSLPVPPLEVQREIVRILDNFTELTAELTAVLTAEIEARQKQYEYYRDKLLSFKEKEQ